MNRPLFVGLLVMFASSSASAQSDVQWTRSRDATLVSKDVGAERWSITRRLVDGRVSGNVFRTDGGPTSFLDCSQVGTDGTSVTLDCYGAGAAPAAYELIAAGLSLPLEFFFPDGEVVRPARLDDLVGSWRVEVQSPAGGSPGVWSFDLATIVGSELRGFNQFGDVATVTITPGGPRSFRLLQALYPGLCGWFQFNLVGLDRIEGETWGVERTTGGCTATRAPGATGATKTLVGYRQ